MSAEWVELTTLGGRRMVVRPQEIVFMAEHPAQDGLAEGRGRKLGWTDVVLRNGDKGECRETIDQIMQQMHPTIQTGDQQ